MELKEIIKMLQQLDAKKKLPPMPMNDEDASEDMGVEDDGEEEMGGKSGGDIWIKICVPKGEE